MKKKKKKTRNLMHPQWTLMKTAKMMVQYAIRAKGYSYYPFLTYKKNAVHNGTLTENSITMYWCKYAIRAKGFLTTPYLTYKRNHDKIFYYKYFRPYSHDYRMTENGRTHHVQLSSEVNFIVPQCNAHGMNQKHHLHPGYSRVTFQPVKKLPSRKFTTCTTIHCLTTHQSTVVVEQQLK